MQRRKHKNDCFTCILKICLKQPSAYTVIANVYNKFKHTHRHTKLLVTSVPWTRQRCLNLFKPIFQTKQGYVCTQNVCAVLVKFSSFFPVRMIESCSSTASGFQRFQRSEWHTKHANHKTLSWKNIAQQQRSQVCNWNNPLTKPFVLFEVYIAITHERSALES